MRRMNLLVSTNDAYVMPLTVLLQSVFDNHHEPMTIWFMWSELSDENREWLKQYIEEHGAEVRYIPISEEAFKGLPTKKYISRETYFRLLAAEYLPEDLDRILWLDADMVVDGDLQDFYDTDLTGYTVAACPHGPAMRATMLENCRNIGVRYPEQYFNAGVMLCNLDEWRRMNIPVRIAEILSRPHTFKFPGQDLTNLLFNGTVKTEDWQVYNCMTHSITTEDAEHLKGTARIIHYAGSAKPWQFYDLPMSDVWKEYYERSPFGTQSLRLTSYFRMKKLFEKMMSKQDPENEQ